jgi:two-component sensor histidine kinase
LESQAAFLENDALKAVESSQHRIFAMSLIHQRLYQSVDIQTVDIASYLSEFLLYLRDSFGSPANIIFEQYIESARLDVSQAIPLALIVNEAVTNAIKYAFPGKRLGRIKITLSMVNDLITFSVEDNGIGMPANLQTGNVSSLGLELIKGLTDDLKGKVRFVNENGTAVVVSFNRMQFNDLRPAFG